VRWEGHASCRERTAVDVFAEVTPAGYRRVRELLYLCCIVTRKEGRCRETGGQDGQRHPGLTKVRRFVA
jgi:hypothetical protein